MVCDERSMATQYLFGPLPATDVKMHEALLFALQPGVHRRAWCAVNDHCSDGKLVWQTKRCVLMEPVMQVSSRGTNLEHSFDRELTHATLDPKPPLDVEVDLKGVDWLHFTG